MDCTCTRLRKHGKDKSGNQRFRCRDCGKTKIETGVRPLGSLRLPTEKAIPALRMLLEGMSIRSTERITGIHRDTLCSLVATVGQHCDAFLRASIRGVPATDIQCDEVWGFVGAKEKNARRLNHDDSHGDAYCFIAIDRETKLVYCFAIGKRSPEMTDLFAEQLSLCAAGTFQISTDGFKPYENALFRYLHGRASHGVLVKKYGLDPNGEGPRRYSPAAIVGIDKHAAFGRPEDRRICTSHIERANLTLRMQVRRMTRLTNAYSKKWENHYAMLALYFAWHNFVRPHLTLKTTPAVAHGLASEPWTIERLLNEAALAA